MTFIYLCLFIIITTTITTILTHTKQCKSLLVRSVNFIKEFVNIKPIEKPIDKLSKPGKLDKPIDNDPFRFILLKFDSNRDGFICTTNKGDAYFSNVFVKWWRLPSYDEVSYYESSKLTSIIERDLLRNGFSTSHIDLKYKTIELNGLSELNMHNALE